ncbi:MAG: polysaccharide biosynthesis/export family protein [Gemmatimonadaceae bacterium]
MMEQRLSVWRPILSITLLAASACSSVQGGYVWANAFPALAPVNRYTVQRGDLLSVQVWDNEKLSARGRVRSDGRISLPLLNDVEVAGKTAEAISMEVQRRLTDDNLMLKPRVTVLVEETPPMTVSVLGKVSRAGTFELAQGAGVAEALAGAGGLTEFAHQDRIFVLRKSPELVRVRFTFKSLTDLTGKAVLFRLLPGDVVVVE